MVEQAQHSTPAAHITALPHLPGNTSEQGHTWAAQWATVPDPWTTPAYRLDTEPHKNAFARQSNKKYTRKTYDYSTGYTRANQEIAWFIYTIWNEGTYRPDPAILRWYSQAVTSLICRTPAPNTTSLIDIKPFRLIQEATRIFYTRKGHYPSPGGLRNLEILANTLHAHLAVRCTDAPWYSHDIWNLKLDPRIPRRENEPHLIRNLHLTQLTQPWLKEAVRYWFSQALTYGYYTWTSLGSHITALNYFSKYLNTTDHTPVTLGEDLPAIRRITTGFVDYLKTPVEGCHSKALSDNTTYNVINAVQRLYEFAYENKALIAESAGEPAWGNLTADHTRLFPTYQRKRNRKAHPVTYFEPEELSAMLAHIDILKTPTDQTITINLPGREPATYQGIGDEQVARIWLIQALTGRRASEILMMDYEPLTMLDVDPAKIQEDSFIARMTYQQTKVDGIEPTILVDTAVVNIIREQQAWVEEKYPGQPHPYLFTNPRGNFKGNQPRSYQSYSDVLQRLDNLVKLTNTAGEQLRFTQTHRLRHTRATELLNNGVPVHVVQRYLGHRSPEMTMRYAETLAATAEAEFLRYKKVGSDGRDLGLSPRDLLEISQLDHRADRILPNGYCMLPPTQTCDKGNACLPCGAFATDASYLEEHRAQLTRLESLIASRKQQYQARRGEPMPETNVWLTGRLREKASLEAIITKLEDENTTGAQAISGAGTTGRVALTLITNPATGPKTPVQANLRTHR
ncbi:tyrosine-type recombinase/integrase [Rothia nasimurium]|uniref:tyrosine-type recombinase/integrase n=1 Tax=Rothia nasimurium TaxID=85336 RepID=UPI003608F9E1